MKNLLLFAITLFLLNSSSFAQNDVVLNIKHKLGDADFTLDTELTNNLGHSFKLTRLQYYISEISVIHDGGTETPIEDKYVLVKNGSLPTIVELGNHDIVEVEAISFHIGVDSAHNHLDPATYPTSHPLAPQNPSMHWGWIGGYRFLALEGNCGSNFDQPVNIHSLGDQNYFKTQVDLSATAENNEIMINIEADYLRGVDDIALDAEMIVHGDYGEAVTALENFRDYVFSPASSTTSVSDFEYITSFEIFPNPTFGITTLKINAEQASNFDVIISDILGKQVQMIRAVANNSNIDFEIKDAGLYFVTLVKDGQQVVTKKLMVN
jgi:hypothetical protein